MHLPVIRSLGALLLIAVCGCGVPGAKSKAGQSIARINRAMWFWHTPFEITPLQERELEQLGIDRVFVRAGTFSYDGERLLPVLRQRWVRAPHGSVHATYNFDAGALRHFEEMRPDQIASVIARTFTEDKRDAKRAGISLSGIQLDIDCPTRLLPKYGELTAQVRMALPKELKLSVTGLTSWLDSPDLVRVVQPLDFFVPQFYEATTPRTINDQSPIADVERLTRGLAKCANLGVPFWVGIPTYGQTLLFETHGRLVGTYRGLSPEDAMRHPALKFSSSETSRGEQRVTFLAVRPGRNGNGAGYRLLYRIPTVSVVRDYLQTIRSTMPANCQGVAFFRIPEPDETMVLPLETLTAVIAGKPVAPRGEATASSESRPWTTIESGVEAQESLRFKLTNRGNEATAFGPDAVEATLTTTAGAIQEARSEDGTLTPISPEGSSAVSLSRASGLVFRRARLAPGATAEIGPVILTKGTHWRLEWRFKTLSGTTLKGNLESPTPAAQKIAR